MLDNFEYDNEAVEFFDIQNLYFDHPLSIEEYEELKTVVLGLNNISQIYIKGTVNLDSIEKIKNLLLMSSTVNDAKIEKIVTCSLKEEELFYFVNSSFKNPDTWSVAYYHDGTNYLVDTIPKVREFFSYIQKIKNIIRKEKLSELERIMRVYDIVKLNDYSDDTKTLTLPEIVSEGKTNSNGFNNLFSYILNSINIKNYIGTIKSSDNKTSKIVLIRIQDKKYNIYGFYLFDPSMDSLPKESYKDDIRMINYNYFSLRIKELLMNKYGDYLKGVLGVLGVDDYDYVKEKIVTNKDIKLRRELNNIMTIFGVNLDTLYKEIHTDNIVDINVISELCNNIYGITIRKDFQDIVKSNYLERKVELFNNNIHDEFKKMLEEEIH